MYMNVDRFLAAQFSAWTYDDVRSFFATLRSSAAAAGLGQQLKLGWMHIGTDKIYDISCGRFSQRHPEIYDGIHAAYHGCSINAARGLADGLAQVRKRHDTNQIVLNKCSHAYNSPWEDGTHSRDTRRLFAG